LASSLVSATTAGASSSATVHNNAASTDMTSNHALYISTALVAVAFAALLHWELYNIASLYTSFFYKISIAFPFSADFYHLYNPTRPLLLCTHFTSDVINWNFSRCSTLNIHP
jgi:hypothetical protein